ncbi:hypothetical protein ES703_15677 [subsurface metagenome]
MMVKEGKSVVSCNSLNPERYLCEFHRQLILVHPEDAVFNDASFCDAVVVVFLAYFLSRREFGKTLGKILSCADQEVSRTHRRVKNTQIKYLGR